MKCTGFCILNAVSRLSTQSAVNSTPPASVLIYTGYTLTTQTRTQGICQVTDGTSVSLATPFSYTLSDDSNDAFALGQDSFADYLGFTDCKRAKGDAITTSSSLSRSKTTGVETSSTPLPATPRTTPHHKFIPLTKDLKIMIGIVVPISVLIFTLSVFGIIRRNAKLRKSKEAQSRENRAEGETTPPFLQRKPELPGEDSRYEVHGLDVRHELPGSMDRQEAPGEELALEAPWEHASAEVKRPP